MATNTDPNTDTRFNVMAVTKESGVSDLTPLKAKGYFAKAIVAERQGNHAQAEEFLKQAVVEEGH